MNYYQPNFYSNYPYNQYQSPMMGQQQLQPVPQAQQPSMPTPTPTPTMQTMGLQGKVVDGEDIVKVTDVPIGGYGVFPKADLSEVYIKSWNSNGTTSITTFKPIIKEEQEEEVKTTNELLEKIKELNEKIDALLTPVPRAAAPVEAQSKPTTTQRKEF